MIRRSLIALALFAGCGGVEPKIAIEILEGEPPLSGLERLQLIVRRCGSDQLALNRDLLPLSESQDAIELAAAVPPGQTYYVWLMGWQSCVPPIDGCVPDDEALPGECTCISGGRNEVIVGDSCTPWLRADDVQTEVTLKLGAVGMCPPLPLRSCDVLLEEE